MENKIRFRDLSWPVRTAVIVSWVSLIYGGLLFLLGMVLELLGV